MTEKKKIDTHAQSIGEILRNPFAYSVPFYQRDFAWTTEEVEALWEDISNALLDRGTDDYFLGAIVATPGNSPKSMDIVDGQQRLAAVSMLFSVMAQAWESLGDGDRARGIERDYLGTEDRRTREFVPKIRLNEINDSAFRTVVLKREYPTNQDLKTWHQSNRRIQEAFAFFSDAISKWLDRFDDKESALLDLEEFIADRLSTIMIEVGNDADAFVIFETLNDRGLDLAVSDLVKNYLFALAGSRIEWFKHTWYEVTTIVGPAGVTQFLRHYWLSTNGLVRERDLYRELRRSIKNTTRARQLLEELRKAAEIYAALSNPEHDYWADFPAEYESYLEALLKFKVTQYRPVALAAMQTLSPAEATKILRLLMIISFRYTVVSALGTGNLEKIYTECALAIREGKAKSAKAVFGLLKIAYVDDTRMQKDFASRQFTNSAIARYILAEINNHMESDPEMEVSTATRKITLEHVLPKKPSPSWRGSYADQEELEAIVSSIGNLTLLERGKNKGLGNVGFKTKRDRAYKTSSLALNDSLGDETNWNADTIRSRAIRLSKEAAKIWRCDY